MNNQKLAKIIDHTCLKPEATSNDIKRLCDEAIKYGFRSVCVNPIQIYNAVSFLNNTNIPVTSVIGFPFGANHIQIKISEASRAIHGGASEIDFVARLDSLITKDEHYVLEEMDTITKVCKSIKHDCIVKVILETSVLNKESIELGCQCAIKSNIDFIKTSSGFHPSGGATIEKVKFIHELVSKYGTKIKASGGIKSIDRVLKMVEAGASIIGTSHGIQIIDQNGKISTTSSTNNNSNTR